MTAVVVVVVVQVAVAVLLLVVQRLWLSWWWCQCRWIRTGCPGGVAGAEQVAKGCESD